MLLQSRLSFFSFPFHPTTRLRKGGTEGEIEKDGRTHSSGVASGSVTPRQGQRTLRKCLPRVSGLVKLTAPLGEVGHEHSVRIQISSQ